MVSSFDVKSIIGKSFRCKCGMVHTVPTKHIVYEDNAISVMIEVLKRESLRNTVVIISDIRTHEVIGKAIAESLKSAGLSVVDLIVPDPPGGKVHCDDVTYEWILSKVVDKPGIFLAVGAGTINDLTKWVAFSMGLPYVVFATAASMTGYTSSIVAPTIKGIKQVVSARPAIGVFAIGKVIENAPFELTTAGLGDALAKPLSSADWIMNSMLFGEHYCEVCTEIASLVEDVYFNNPEGIKRRQQDVIKALFHSLVYCGIAMTIAGTDVTPSGGEHIFSHTLDMLADVDGGANDYHGRQVGVGTILSSALYGELMKIKVPQIKDLPEDIDREFWGRLSDNVAKDYSKKLKRIKTMQEKFSDKIIWLEYINRIEGIVKSPEQIRECLKRAGGAYRFADLGCDRERIKSVILHMHEMGSRCTVVDLAWVMGILPEKTDYLIDNWLG